MTYALGRRLEYTDMPAVRAIVRDAAKKGDQASRRSCWAWSTAPRSRWARPIGNEQRRAAEVERQR